MGLREELSAVSPDLSKRVLHSSLEKLSQVGDAHFDLIDLLPNDVIERYLGICMILAELEEGIGDEDLVEPVEAGFLLGASALILTMIEIAEVTAHEADFPDMPEAPAN